MPHDTSPMHEVSHIETPEHVALRFHLAGVPSRGFAYIIDFLVQLIPLTASLVAAIILSPATFVGKTWVEKQTDGQVKLSLLAEAVGALALFCINFGYFFFFEVFWRGQTPGKRALKIRVMRDGGYPIEPRAALVRNLLRAVDFLPAFYLIGMVSLFWGRAGKRLGDYAAGTLVIQEKRDDASVDDDADAHVESAAVRAAPRGNLTADERRLIRDYLSRADTLDAAVSARLAAMIASNVSARLGLPAPPDPHAFLLEAQADAHR